MPIQEGGPGAGGGERKDLGQAIEYVKRDSGGLVAAVRWLGGFFAALFARKRKA